MINILLYQILASTIHGKKIKNSYKNNRIKTSAPTRNDKFELPHGSCFVSDIQNYFEYIIEKYNALLGQTTKTVTDNLPVSIYVEKKLNIELLN